VDAVGAWSAGLGDRLFRRTVSRADSGPTPGRRAQDAHIRRGHDISGPGVLHVERAAANAVHAPATVGHQPADLVDAVGERGRVEVEGPPAAALFEKAGNDALMSARDPP
jgi:hypothetical protein